MVIQAQKPGGDRIRLDVNSKLINRNSSGQPRKSFGIGLGSILRRQPIERAGKCRNHSESYQNTGQRLKLTSKFRLIKSID